MLLALCIVVLSVLLSVLAPQAVAAERTHLSVAYCVDCVPFHFQDEQGEPAGLIIDHWRLWSEKTGIELQFVAAPWNETLEMVGSGAADAHAGLFYSEERDAFLDYGTALRKTDTHVFFHQGIPATTEFRQLAAYRIGVIAGDYVEGFLKDRVPGGHIVGYPDYQSLVEALEAGELKVFAADTPTGLFHLKKAGLLGVFSFVRDGPLYRNDWFAAARDGDAATLAAINRGMDRITEAEIRQIGRRWIGDARVAAKDDALIVAIDRNYPPFTFMNAQGRPAGMFVDLWRTWAEKTGRKVRFRPSNWSETLEGLKSGDVDVHSGLSFSEERAKWIGFTRQFFRTASRIYYRASDPVPGDIGAFGDRWLGAEGSSFQAAEVRRLYPGAKVRDHPTNAAMIDALLKGNVDAVVQESQTMDEMLREMGLQGVIVARPERLFVSTIHAGVLKTRTGLLAEVEAGLGRLSDKELAEIEARWIADPGQRFHGRGLGDLDVGLTRAERDWLNAHPIIRLGSDRAWPPFEYLDDQGRHRGLSAQFVKRIQDILEFTFQPPQSLPWSENIERAKRGGLDILTAVAPTPEREKFLVFTRPYMTWPNVIATRNDTRGITGVEDLDGKRVGVVAGYAIEEIMVREHPALEVVPHKDIPEGLLALSTGRIDAFVDSFGTISHFTRQMQLGNIVVVAPTPHIVEIAFGVRKDWPELAAILDKALATISADDRARLLEATGLPSRIPFAAVAKAPEDHLLSPGEALLLAIVVVVMVGVIVALGWLIRSQRRPFLQSLRGKSVLFLAAAFLLVGSVTIWVFALIGDHIAGRLGQHIAERHVLWHKEKVLRAVDRELALAKQMAESQVLMRWADNEADATLAAHAREELQRYRDNFRAKSYFVGLTGSRHFFYADDNVKDVTLDVIDTLSRDDPDDIWFFATIESDAPYNLNVDHNVELGVTNLWVNYAMRHGGRTLGVVGTGVGLTEFINEFIAQEAEGVATMMIDGGGAIQAHVDPDMITHNVLGKESGESAGIWGLLSGEKDRATLRNHMAGLQSGSRDAETFFLHIGGQRSLVAMAYLAPLKGYTVAVFDPGSLAGVREKGALAGVFAGALLITAIVFVFGQNLLIVRPLLDLTQGARRMSGGDYDVRLAVTQRDEIGDLTGTFNDMASTIADYTRNLETKVAERTEELSDAYDVISSSIEYASNIQRSLLPREEYLAEDLAEHFVIWEPRDVVGGDLYWYRRCKGGFVIVLADCTGHGVPGAFMTMLSNGALDRALRERPDGDPAHLLAVMNRSIKHSLGQHQDKGESDDGLELGICRIDPEARTLAFAGARFSLFHANADGVHEIKGDKAGIGYRRIPVDQPFVNRDLGISDEDTFYMTTDGLTDQVGGENRRMFGKRRFLDLIASVRNLPLAEQRDRILAGLTEYQGTETRRDDVCVIGFRV